MAIHGAEGRHRALWDGDAMVVVAVLWQFVRFLSTEDVRKLLVFFWEEVEPRLWVVFVVCIGRGR
jgi:hypothetical protein